MSTWLLLRGLTREQGHWGDFLPRLHEALPAGDVVLTPDLPGNGTLWQTRSPATVAGMLEACRAQLADAGHAPPYHVVAMSLGAMVTVHWAHTHPEELACAALINTSLRPFSPFWHRLRPANYPRILHLLLTQPPAHAMAATILAMTANHPADRAGTLAHWAHLSARHPVSAANAVRQLWAAARYRAPRARASVPMLLINSAGDRLVHPDCTAVLARAWGLPMLRHPTAGHDLPLDAPDWLVTQLLLWAQAQTQAHQAPGPTAPSAARHPRPPPDQE